MFKKLSDSLKAKFARKDYLSHQLEIVKVFDIYDKAAGIKPTSLKNKILTVQAKSSVEASQLRLGEKELIEKINQQLNKEMVKRIVYRF